MIQIIYTSIATRLFSVEDLREVLDHAREANRRKGLSGMLIYSGGDFLQLLEGPEDAVVETYSKICLDERHESVRKVAQVPIKQRKFADWAMGFADTSEIPPNFDGYVDLKTAFSELDETYASSVLGWFRTGAWHSVAA
jgi:hypothetical protein